MRKEVPPKKERKSFEQEQDDAAVALVALFLALVAVDVYVHRSNGGLPRHNLVRDLGEDLVVLWAN